jgi:hypothetical protein
MSYVPVAGAVGHDAVRVELGLLANPIEQGADPLVGAVAMEAVVEHSEPFAEACGSAHVGEDHGNAQLSWSACHKPSEKWLREFGVSQEENTASHTICVTTGYIFLLRLNPIQEHVT